MAASFHVLVCVRPNATEPGAPALGEMDLRAVVFAVRLAREIGADARVTAVSAGGEDAVWSLRECMARGVNETVRVTVDPDDQDGLRTASQLASVVDELRPDLVLCGDRSELGMHGTVPRELAHRLGLPFVSAVVELDIDRSGASAYARAVQRLERGDRWTWCAHLPIVCGVDPEICAPQYLAVRRRQRARTGMPQTVDPRASGAAELDVSDGFGKLVVEARVAPRIRPKKSKVATATMSAADRMKLLRGGGKPSVTPSSGEESAPRRITGDPEAAAAEIIKLLEKLELIDP